MKQLVALMIDDMINQLDILEQRFLAIGFVVHKALSGEEGLRLLALHPKIDVVIYDLQMPDLDGLEFVKRARKFYPLIPIFLMSESPHLGFEITQTDGATHLLSKTFIDVERVARAAKNWPYKTKDLV